MIMVTFLSCSLDLLVGCLACCTEDHERARLHPRGLLDEWVEGDPWEVVEHRL